MPRDRIVTGIDIGSSKICTVIASAPLEEVFDPRSKVSVIGVATVPSKGIKKGVVVDIDEAVEAIARSLEGAERMAGYAASSAYVVVNGKHISSLNSHGVVAVAHPEGEISDNDVVRVTEAAQAISIPSSREIIHVIPRGFIVDNQDEIHDPVGMTGVRLEVETNIISGSTTVMRNLVKCGQQVGVSVADLVFEGIASSEAVLTNTEKELGTVLVDIGGGTTSIIVFSAGSSAYSIVLPIGGQNITNDLAVGLRLSLEDAEKIKLKLSQEEHLASLKIEPRSRIPVGVSDGEKKAGDEFDISEFGLEQTVVSRKLAKDIINARLGELFRMVGKEVKNSDLGERLPAGVVLTGGAAETVGATEIAKKVLGLPLRIGYPQGATGLIDETNSPVYSAAIGLVLYGVNFVPTSRMGRIVSREKLGGLLKRLIGWIKSFLP